jgi:hypothetical protein
LRLVPNIYGDIQTSVVTRAQSSVVLNSHFCHGAMRDDYDIVLRIPEVR